LLLFKTRMQNGTLGFLSLDGFNGNIEGKLQIGSLILLASRRKHLIFIRFEKGLYNCLNGKANAVQTSAQRKELLKPKFRMTFFNILQKIVRQHFGDYYALKCLIQNATSMVKIISAHSPSIYLLFKNQRACNSLILFYEFKSNFLQCHIWSLIQRIRLAK